MVRILQSPPFVCIECGLLSQAPLTDEVPALRLCWLCLSEPGWTRDPELRRLREPKDAEDPPSAAPEPRRARFWPDP